MRRVSLFSSIAFVTLLSACSTEALPSRGALSDSSNDAHRADTVIDVLTAADAPLIALRPDEVAAKYAKMARSPFFFLRGNLPLFDHDLADHPEVESRFPDALAVLQNDPHPENLGTLGDANYLVVDWNDFDGSNVGATVHDVFRGAIGVSVFSRVVTGDTSARPISKAFLKAYRDVDLGDGGKILADLLSAAETKGAARKEITDDVVSGGPQPLLVRAADRVDVDAATRAAIESSLAGYDATRLYGAPALGTLRDVIRIEGKGVASLPVLRYELLLAGPAADGSKDLLLEMKEAWDWKDAQASTEDAAWSVVDGRRIDDATPTLDLNLGVAHVDSNWFSVRTVSAFQQGVSHKDVKKGLADGTYSRDDLLALARYLGGNLALAHLQGGATSTALNLTRATDLAESWADRNDSDAAKFAARLATDGPLFGH